MKIKHAIEELKKLNPEKDLYVEANRELGMVTGLVTDPTGDAMFVDWERPLEKQKHDLYKYTKSTEGKEGPYES
ncbi:hypothetical protein [Bacillus phage SPO1L3]|nr:hypothetical protein Goe9_c01990 [Bacillus phage vB_BsuM-Goe9]WIT26330.1 hypothetical protein [Bacillus phage SPO1L3]WIT26729.1 hypothetical protein [Bacillus phage SPO1L5]